VIESRHRLVVVGGETASFDVALDLESARDGLVVICDETASLDVARDLETARDRLVVIGGETAGFDIRFDFHCRVLLHSHQGMINAAVFRVDDYGIGQP
jgi:hypothetical protein